MKQRWFVVALILLVTLLALLSFGGRQASNTTTGKDKIPGLEISENNLTASIWAKEQLNKYPYNPGSFSGTTFVIESLIEVWFIGRKVEHESYNPRMVGIENSYGKFFAKLIDNPTYAGQDGDRFDRSVLINIIKPGEIKAGDFIAVKTTLLDNFPLAVEVRLLKRKE